MPRPKTRPGLWLLASRLASELDLVPKWWQGRAEFSTDQKLATAVLVGLARRRWEMACADLAELLGLPCSRFHVALKTWQAMTDGEREIWWRIYRDSLEAQQWGGASC